MPTRKYLGLEVLVKGQLDAQDTLNQWLHQGVDRSLYRLLSRAEGIDGTAAADHAVYAVPNGRRLIPLLAIVRVIDADTVTVDPSISLGANNSDYGDFFTDTSCALQSTGRCRSARTRRLFTRCCNGSKLYIPRICSAMI